LVFKNWLWLGTGDGFVYIYMINSRSKNNDNIRGQLSKPNSLQINTIQNINKNILFSPQTAAGVHRAHTLANPFDVTYLNRAKSLLCLNERVRGVSEDSSDLTSKKNVELVNSYISILEFRLSNNIEMLKKKLATGPLCKETLFEVENEQQHVSNESETVGEPSRFCSLPASYYSREPFNAGDLPVSKSLSEKEIDVSKRIYQRDKPVHHQRRLTQFQSVQDDGYEGNSSSEEEIDQRKIPDSRKQSLQVNSNSNSNSGSKRAILNGSKSTANANKTVNGKFNFIKGSI
jgi:hypothetical protein